MAAPAALAQGAPRVVDLTHTLSADFPTYFGEPGYEDETLFAFADSGFNLKTFSVNEHTGTHLDAPLHFSADGHSVDAVPVGDLHIPRMVVYALSGEPDGDAGAGGQTAPGAAGCHGTGGGARPCWRGAAPGDGG